MHHQRIKTLVTLLAAALLLAQASAQRLPLVPLPDDGERAFWWYYQVQEEAPLEALQAVVGAPATPLAVTVDTPVRIAVIYPSLDVSDAWLRGYLAMVARLEEIGLPFEAVQFASGINDHVMQATYTEQVINDDYEYVVYGPTELLINAENIRDLVAAGKKVIIFTYDQVLQTLGDDQPLMYAAFSHYNGSQIKCDWVLENLGTSGSYAVMRGVPGLVDDQRSGGFIDCLEQNSDWKLAYEHYGNFEREGGFSGSQQVLTAYPEVTLIHNANTAMAMGTLSAVLSMNALDRVTVSGWGGTGDELDALVRGELGFTPMRMADDLGVAMAEAIRYDVEGRADELPLVFLGRMTIATGDMTEAEVLALREVAFRYTGVAALER
ncbi:MAG: substrate-binding domain-containing protein [Trueperaceae bacterium]|nr:substrate-binding domain-containing protein [Trueperaceae bacterium]